MTCLCFPKEREERKEREEEEEENQVETPEVQSSFYSNIA